MKNIPAGINRRLSSISSDERSFDREAPPYQKVLDESGYNYRLKFDPPRTGHRRTRERNILWFNPPFSKSVSTNIGKKFLALVDRCSHRGHTLNTIFNRNTIKISYSCMSNVKQLIDSHNKRLLAAYNPSLESAKTKLCNCRKKGECPLNGQCLTSGVVYQAKIRRKDNDKFETYVGLTADNFKTRYRNHKTSFEHKSYRNSTELSKHVWSLKDSNIEHEITWQIVCRAKPYSSLTKRCNLCLSEKFVIICEPERCTLNKRNELVSSCRHRAKALQQNN